MESGVKGGGLSDSQLGTSFSALLAAREAQDNALRIPVASKQYATPSLAKVAAGQELILKESQGISSPQDGGGILPTTSKQKDIDMILQGDFE
jgi:hypothetical protein